MARTVSFTRSNGESITSVLFENGDTIEGVLAVVRETPDCQTEMGFWLLWRESAYDACIYNDAEFREAWWAKLKREHPELF